MRVAVIGTGPKGLFAIERLLARSRSEPLAVVAFDPRPPGEGAAYATSQPDWLRLNVNSTIVDAGWRSGPWPSPPWLVAFDQWRAGPGSDPFAPRRKVGDYLGWVWRGLVANLPEHTTLTHRAQRVTAVEAGPRWSVDGENYDEVLLATGHADDWPGALRHRWHGHERLVPAVFPLDGLADVRPNDAVAVRGAALTFLDAVLTLTQGRGGRFEGTGPLRYEPCGGEPAVIWPTSRGGRFMEVKPEPGSALARLDRADAVDAAAAALAKADTAGDALTHVPLLARGLLALAGHCDDDGIDAVLTGAPAGDPTEALRRSWEVATERCPPTAAWALGQAWRDLAPALALRFSGVGEPDAFSEFAAMAARLERVAFGPPPGNAAKLLALLDAGVVDSASLADGVVDSSGFRWRSGPGPGADVVVDAVLPPPGATPVPGSLPGRLLASGLLTAGAGRRGVAIDPDGTCLTKDGGRLAGLAALGRPTEDVTIGNDTLNRSLHDTADRWAARITGTQEAT